MLQNYIKDQTGILKYYVFDIMNLDGNDLTSLSLLQRKELLKILLSKQLLKNIRFSEHTFENGKALFAKAEKDKAEGIMAKKADSPYRIGQRSDHWLKIKIAQQEEAIIIGFTEPKNGRSFFGAVLLAQYQGKNLKFIGKCGTGFTEQKLEELYNLFQKNLSEESPITEKSEN
jgi:bifunctional non-homologous end joining protein LigD